MGGLELPCDWHLGVDSVGGFVFEGLVSLTSCSLMVDEGEGGL